MTPRRRLATVLLLCVLLPGPARAAQQPAAEPVPGESVPAPPLVPVEAAPELDVPLAPREEPEPRQGSSVPLGVRAFGELLGAGITGATGGLVGAIVGPALSGCEGEGCLGPAILGMLIGAAAGLPVGVYGAGRLMGVPADSSALWASYLGMGVGGGAALLTALAVDDEDGLSFIGVPAGALMGAIVGFELAASVSSPDSGAAPGPALRLTPTVGTTPRGGFVGGLSGQF